MRALELCYSHKNTANWLHEKAVEAITQADYSHRPLARLDRFPQYTGCLAHGEDVQTNVFVRSHKLKLIFVS